MNLYQLERTFREQWNNEDMIMYGDLGRTVGITLSSGITENYGSLS